VKKIVNLIRLGIPLVIVDDKKRENEADLFIAASQANKKNLNFILQEAKGLMCLPCSGPILDKLNIPMMVKNSTDKFGTPFTVSVDAAKGTTSGMSVSDRLKTIKVFLDDKSHPDDLNRPGHMFPLRAKDGLLQERCGHTELSIELCRLAKLKEVGIICELIDNCGGMMRRNKTREFARLFGLEIVSVDQVMRELYGCAVL